MIKKIVKFIIFLFGIFCLGQNKNTNKEKAEIYSLPLKSSDRIIDEGKKILTISKTVSDTSKGYYYLFMGYYLKGDFSNSILFAKKADIFFLKHHQIENRFMATYYLALSYQKAGFIEKAYKNTREAEKIAEKLNNVVFKMMVLDIKAHLFESEKKYSEAILYRFKNIAYLEKNPYLSTFSVFKFQKCDLALDYLMIDNLVQAKKQIATFEADNNNIYSETKDYRVATYYICKAIIAAKENQEKKAVTFFDKAIFIAKENKANDQLMIFLEHRLNLNIDNIEKREELFKEFVHLKDLSKNENSEVIKEEIIEEHIKLANQTEYKYLAAFIGVILSIAAVIYKRRKRQKQKKYFEEIIKNIEIRKSTHVNSVENVKQNFAVAELCDKLHDTKTPVLLDETTDNLLQKLICFENGKEFTAKNFTLSNFVSILDTNAKYANSLLKEYRGKSFNEYINDLRIKYILDYLHENPESLRYKLTYLSDLAGFSSHSYFTKVFTKKNKITPSKFITSLKEKNEKI